MNTPSQMLPSAPTRAPGRTCANAQMRVRAPTSSLSHSARSWTKTSSIGLTRWELGDIGGRDLRDLAHDRAGPALGGLIRPEHVGPDDPEPQQVDAAEEHEHEDRRRVARNGDRTGGTRDQDDRPDDDPDHQSQPADQPEDAHRKVGEREHAVGQVADLARERPAALA